MKYAVWVPNYNESEKIEALKDMLCRELGRLGVFSNKSSVEIFARVSKMDTLDDLLDFMCYVNDAAEGGFAAF